MIPVANAESDKSLISFGNGNDLFTTYLMIYQVMNHQYEYPIKPASLWRPNRRERCYKIINNTVIIFKLISETQTHKYMPTQISVGKP